MKISLAESRIMDVLWRLGEPAAAEDVTAAIADDQEWAHGTVRSLLTRLVKKKAVAARMEGRRYLYRPLIAKADYAQAESENLLARLFDGRLAPFVTQFAKQENLSDEELADIQRVIERLDRGR